MRTTAWYGAAVASIALFVGTTSRAAAQTPPRGAAQPATTSAPTTSFAELSRQLTTGETVLVTDVTGHSVKGTVVRVSDNTLVLRRHRGDLQLAAPTVLRVARLKSSVWLGAAIGASAGFAFGAILVATDTSDCSGFGPCFNTAEIILPAGAVFGALGAGSGALVGAFFPRQRVVFARPAKGEPRAVVTPWLSRGGTGVLVQIRF
jgi:hypothetical protein